MRTAQAKYERLERLLDARVAHVEAQGFNTALLEWKKLRASERRWREKRREWQTAIIDELMYDADMAIIAAEEAIQTTQNWLLDFAKSQGIN